MQYQYALSFYVLLCFTVTVFVYFFYNAAAKINSCVIPNSLEDLGRFLYRSPPELCFLCAPDSSATLSAICTGTIRNFMGHLHRDPPNLISHPEPSRTWPFETSSGICIGTLRNFVCYVHRTAQQLCLLSAPEPSKTSWAICTGTPRTWSAIRNPPEPDRSRPHQASASEPSGTLSAMCTGQLSNFVCYLHRNHPELHGPSAPGPSELDQPSGTLQHLISPLRRNRPEPHQLFARNRLHRYPSEPYLQSAPELAGTSSAFCPETLRNLISHLHRNPPEPCLLSAPEPSGTSSASCPGTVRNLISHLHRNPPEPHQQSAPEGSGTLRNLLRNLVLQLHRIAPELFWAKDPIASFAVGEKHMFYDVLGPKVRSDNIQ